MEKPLIHSGDNTWTPSGIAYFYGKLYFGALRGESLKSYEIESGEMEDIFRELGRIRDVFGDKDFICFISNNTDGRGDLVSI